MGGQASRVAGYDQVDEPDQNDEADHDLTQKEDAADGVVSVTDWKNLSIPTSYFLVGFGPNFLGTPLSVYMVHTLNAAPDHQNTISILMQLPWCFKVVYGFISDGFPIFGQRRKPYFVIGYTIYVLSCARLAVAGTPTYDQLCLYCFTATCGQIMADVMTDTMIVERAKLESEERRGQFQATCYSVRFFGSICGSTAGACVYNKADWGWGLSFSIINWINVVVPILLLMPSLPYLYDPVGVTIASVGDQISSIWRTVSKKAVWLPMSFIYFYNAMQWGNVAWSSYLQLSLGFKPFELGTLAIAGNVMTLAGVMVYKKYFFKTGLRTIYMWTTIIPMIFSIAQLMLIFQINTRYFGISDYAFSMGDNVITVLVAAILFLPVCILFASMCPDGCEGCIYAILTSYANVASVVGGTFSNLASHIWDVSNKALKAHKYGGLWRLTVFTSLICCVPLFCMFCLLPSAERQRELTRKPEHSRVGGTVFLLVLALSISWAVGSSLVTIL